VLRNEREGRAEIESYLREHGVSDKDARVSSARRNAPKTNGLEKSRKGILRKVIDLHGMTLDNAGPALDRAMEECRQKGIRELLVIHGWGRHSGAGEAGILKRMVLQSLELRFTLVVREFGPALPRDGGEGATVVRLK